MLVTQSLYYNANGVTESIAHAILHNPQAYFTHVDSHFPSFVQCDIGNVNEITDTNHKHTYIQALIYNSNLRVNFKVYGIGCPWKYCPYAIIT